MKKVLVTVAALGLVAGVASTASAVEWKMSGKYMVEGYYMDSALEGAAKGVDLTQSSATDEDTSDSWYQHTFEVSPTMKVNDKVSMLATVRMAKNTVWGSQTDGDTTGGFTSSSSNDVVFHTLYMNYMSPIGEVRIGRHPAGGYGTLFADTDSRQDRIMWFPNFLSKPWSMLFFTAKATEGDLLSTDVSSAHDSDVYEARLNYKDDALDAGIRFSFSNNNAFAASTSTSTVTLPAGGYVDNTVINVVTTTTTGATSADEKELYAGYAKYKMGNYFANVEFAYYNGDNTTTVDWDALGAMVELGGKFNNLTASAMYFYAEGDNNSADTDNNSFFSATSSGTGHEFTPLYILTGRTAGLLNNEQTGNIQVGNSGVQAFVLAADYKVSDALSLHGAIGYAQADEEPTNYDDEYGWEYNIGAAYKLLDNLTYEAHFGYLDTGDYFKLGNAATNTENVYILSHHLTMTF